MNKAEIISRRLSVFMQLMPGITKLILSPSIQRTDTSKESGADQSFIINHQLSFAAEMLREMLSMLSLSIQSLYGSKKGGLLTARAGSNETAQRNRAKTLFAEAAKEYAPTLLQVVSMLEQPIDACKKHNASVNSDVAKAAASEESKVSLPNSQASETHVQSDTIARIRSDSTDKDWVDVVVSSDAAPSPLASSSKNAGSKAKGESRTQQLPPGRKCYDDLVSCQAIALYAVSRLTAQAMKYGGGEASTAVWRVVISSLSIDDSGLKGEQDGLGKDEASKLSSNQTLCHLIALVCASCCIKYNHPPLFTVLLTIILIHSGAE